MVSRLGKEGCWRKALEIYQSLPRTGVRPDTAITNAAISACDKGMVLSADMSVATGFADATLRVLRHEWTLHNLPVHIYIYIYIYICCCYPGSDSRCSGRGPSS